MYDVNCEMSERNLVVLFQNYKSRNPVSYLCRHFKSLHSLPSIISSRVHSCHGIYHWTHLHVWQLLFLLLLHWTWVKRRSMSVGRFPTVRIDVTDVIHALVCLRTAPDWTGHIEWCVEILRYSWYRVTNHKAHCCILYNVNIELMVLNSLQ
jgi:hypothetical protein